MKKKAILGLTILAGAGALAGSLLCFRRQTRPYPGVGSETVSYCWCRPRHVVHTDLQGKRYWFSDLDPRNATARPTRELIDLFGTGKISEFVTTLWGDRFGPVQTREIATGDDSRIDLLLEFHGRALVRAEAVDAACASWQSYEVSVAGRRAARTECTDATAVHEITRARALEIVATLALPPERGAMLSDRLQRATDHRERYFEM